MARRPRRNHSAAFKAKVALAALKGDKSLREQKGVQWTDFPENERTGHPVRPASEPDQAVEIPVARWRV